MRFFSYRLTRTDEIRLAQFRTRDAQDVVGRGAVEEQVGQGELLQIFDAGEILLAVARLETDVTIFAAVDLLALERLDVDQRPFDARIDFRESLLVVLETLRFRAGQPRRAARAHV